MVRCSFLTAGLLFLGLTLSISATGCQKKSAAPDDEKVYSRPRTSQGGEEAKAREPLKAPLDGFLKGRVVYKGAPPAMPDIEAMKNHPDSKVCLMPMDPSDTRVQTWLLGKDNGVANVLVYLKPADGKFFYLTKKDLDDALYDSAGKKWDRRKVILDQPFCAFHPHNIVMFPQYIDEDGKTLKDSGQEFIVRNSSPVNHNSAFTCNPRYNDNINQTLGPKDEKVFAFKPQPNEMEIRCSIHPWMLAYAWAFEHPYAAITDSDGYFFIPNVPTGVEVNLVAWHEQPKFFHGGKEGTPITLKKGDNQVNLEVSAK